MIAEWNVWVHRRSHSVWKHYSGTISRNFEEIFFSYSSPPSISKKFFASSLSSMITVSFIPDPSLGSVSSLQSRSSPRSQLFMRIIAFLARLSISCLSAYPSSLRAPAMSDLLISNHSHYLSLRGFGSVPLSITASSISLRSSNTITSLCLVDYHRAFDPPSGRPNLPHLLFRILPSPLRYSFIFSFRRRIILVLVLSIMSRRSST